MKFSQDCTREVDTLGVVFLLILWKLILRIAAISNIVKYTPLENNPLLYGIIHNIYSTNLHTSYSNCFPRCLDLAFCNLCIKKVFLSQWHTHTHTYTYTHTHTHIHIHTHTLTHTNSLDATCYGAVSKDRPWGAPSEHAAKVRSCCNNTKATDWIS